MLVVRCPNCGAPTQVSLAQPDRIHCQHCGYEGAPDPSARQAIWEASQAVRSMSAREKSLSKLQRRMVTGNGLMVVGAYILASSLLGGPILGFSIVSMILYPLLGIAVTREVLITIGPAVLFLLLGYAAVLVIGLLILRHLTRRLQQSVSAIPPPTDGMPSVCRFCGADLPPGKPGVIVTCSFCGTENLLPTKRIRHIHQQHAIAVHQAQQQWHSQFVKTRSMAQALTLVGILAALAVPVASLVGNYVLGLVLDSVEFSPDEEARFAWWPSAYGTCLARAEQDGKTTRLDFRHRGPLGVPDKFLKAAGQKLSILTADKLVGRKVIGKGNRPIIITRVFRTLKHPQSHLIAGTTKTGEEIIGFATGTCLLDKGAPTEVRGDGPSYEVDASDLVQTGQVLIHLTREMGEEQSDMFLIPKSTLRSQATGHRTLHPWSSVFETNGALVVLARKEGLVDTNCIRIQRKPTDENGETVSCYVERQNYAHTGDYIFFAKDEILYRYSLKDKKKRIFARFPLHIESTPEMTLYSVAASSDKIYLMTSDLHNKNILFASSIGQWKPEMVAEVGADFDTPLFFTHDTLYWLCESHLMALSLTDRKSHTLTQKDTKQIAVSNRAVCFSSSWPSIDPEYAGPQRVACIPAGDTNLDRIRGVGPNAVEARNLLVDDKRVYWTEKGGRVLWARIP